MVNMQVYMCIPYKWSTDAYYKTADNSVKNYKP